jgi:putative flippase GtrA
MLTMSHPTAGGRQDTDDPEGGARSLWNAHRQTAVRLLRYAAVSLVATATSTLSLGVMVGVIGLAAVWSNIAATAIGTVPSFELNRRWVWGRTDQRSLLRQVVPFCALSLAGLVVSTVAVGVVANLTSDWSRLDRTLAVEFANLAAYGSLWIVQYQLLNRFLFAGSGPTTAFTAESQTAHSQPESGPPMLTATGRSTIITETR